MECNCNIWLRKFFPFVIYSLLRVVMIIKWTEIKLRNSFLTKKTMEMGKTLFGSYPEEFGLHCKISRPSYRTFIYLKDSFFTVANTQYHFPWLKITSNCKIPHNLKLSWFNLFLLQEFVCKKEHLSVYPSIHPLLSSCS